MNFNKRILVVSTNAMCSVYFSVNVACVCVCYVVATHNIVPPPRTLCFTGHLTVCLFAC